MLGRLKGKWEVGDDWETRQIEVGDDWYPAIEKASNEVKVAVMLISASFLNFAFIQKEGDPAPACGQEAARLAGRADPNPSLSLAEGPLAGTDPDASARRAGRQQRHKGAL